MFSWAAARAVEFAWEQAFPGTACPYFKDLQRSMDRYDFDNESARAAVSALRKSEMFIKDAALIAAAQRVEHYEIAGYIFVQTDAAELSPARHRIVGPGKCSDRAWRINKFGSDSSAPVELIVLKAKPF
jgi:hypothetical protein